MARSGSRAGSQLLPVESLGEEAAFGGWTTGRTRELFLMMVPDPEAPDEVRIVSQRNDLPF